MKRSYHTHTICALLALCALVWMGAQPRSATTAYAQLPPLPPPTATPAGMPVFPNGEDPCGGNVTISGTVIDTDGTPIKDAVIQLDEVQLPNFDREATSCSGYRTNEDGEFAITNFRATEWMLSIQPPIGNETLFATQGMHLVIEDGDTIEFDEPFVLTNLQITALATLQDEITPSLARYKVYQPVDFNDDGEVACYLSTPEVAKPFDSIFYKLEDSLESEYVAFQRYTESDGEIEIGGLPEGDYCLRVTVIDTNAEQSSSIFLPVIEQEFTVTNLSDSINLGTLRPAPTPKRLILSAYHKNGEPVTDVLLSVFKITPPAGGAYSRFTDNSSQIFDLTGGTWGIYLQENEGTLFSRSDADSLLEEVTFAEDESTQALYVSVEVDSNAAPPPATIRGTVQKPDGSPAIGAEGTISLHSGTAGADDWQWQSTNIDPETATFETTVISGTWNLSYSLHVYDAADEYAAYRPIGQATLVSVAEDATANIEMTLIEFDSTVLGSVLRPDGTAMSTGRVWVRDGGFTRRPVEIVDGVFETGVLSGLEYVLEVDDESGTLAADSLGLPDFYYITALPDSTNEVVLQLQQLDTTISGAEQLDTPLFLPMFVRQ